MKFFQNRFVALLIAAVVVIGSTAANAAVGLDRAGDRLEAGFFTAKSGKAPNYYVDQQISAAASLATIGGHYAGKENAVAELRDARAELVDAQKDRDISDMGDACSRLSRRADELISLLEKESSLTAEDRDTLTDIVTTLEGTARKLHDSDYNEAVLDFSRGSAYQRFWIDLLDIDGPELFDAPSY